ncbi:UNVERIFIED_CONTAM: hypothetical protein Sindi_2593000 [Sesamum indicum]
MDLRKGGQSHLGQQIAKYRGREEFSEQICKLAAIGNMRRQKETSLETIPNQMAIDFEVLGGFVENWISHNVQGSLVVTVKRNRSRNGNTKVLKKIRNPAEFTSSGTKTSIFRFSSGSSNRGLFLRLP